MLRNYENKNNDSYIRKTYSQNDLSSYEKNLEEGEKKISTKMKKKTETKMKLTVCLIGKEMIKRLETMHERGLIHRDLKPNNLTWETNY